MKSFVGQLLVSLVCSLAFWGGVVGKGSIVYADDELNGWSETDYQETLAAVNAVVVAEQEYYLQALAATQLFQQVLEVRAQFLLSQDPQAELIIPLVDFWLYDANNNIFASIALANSGIDDGIIATALWALQDPEDCTLIIVSARRACQKLREATAMVKTATNELNLAIEAMQGGGSAPPMMVPGF